MVCEIVELTPSACYYRPTGRDDLGLWVLIDDVVRRFPTYGHRWVTAQLQREGCDVNHNRVHRVIQ